MKAHDFEALYTAAQMRILLSSWGSSEPLPKKKDKVVIMFPGKALNVAEVTKTELKGTYGDRLYRVQMRKE